MIKFIDARLNGITMYRLVLYYLLALLGVAVVYAFAGVLPFNPLELILSIGFLVAVCWIINGLFAWAFHVPANVESVYISALILAVIVAAAQNTHSLLFLVWVSVLAMASKYILAISRKHLFNPVAFAVALVAITVGQATNWWVGNVQMLPFVLIGGLLIVRKVQRFEMVIIFLVGALVTTLGLTVLNGKGVFISLEETILYSPLVFFAAVILTEPLTTPPTITLQLVYGAMVGFLFSPQFHIGSFYTTPELAILLGNVFSYIVSPKAKLTLALKDRVQIGPDTFNFIFTPNQKLSFAPGQYMEWTLGHDRTDSRGNRRYFTLANSPTEQELILGVKFYPHSSSYKRSMLAMQRNSEIVASKLEGEFTLPADPNKRLVFIAGGIGITPFRSMIKYLLDKRQKRPITVFYANRTVDEIVYKDVLDQAQKYLGIKTIYTLTDTSQIPAEWTGQVGYITGKMLRTQVPYFRDCIYYLSGPNSMVKAFEETLTQLHIPREHIRTDFFPGF